MAGTIAAGDEEDLAGFGYRQRLERTLGGFSAFAAGFSYLSILTGLPQMFYLGYAAGGPASAWAWPAVFAGQGLVALCFAELAAEFPVSGGVYQWASRLGPAWAGWMAGWVYLAGAVVSLAAVALAIQASLPKVAPWARVVGVAGVPADEARNAAILGCGLIALSTAVNALGVRALARLNNAAAVVEMIGAAVLIVLLWSRARRGLGVVLDRQGRGDGLALGYLGPLLAASLTSAYVLNGFDAAGMLSEETNDPRRRGPRAILGALGAAGGAGFLLILGTLLAADDLGDPELGRPGGGMAHVIGGVLGGGGVGRALLAVVALAVAACTLTVHAAAVRLVFSMARDGLLPFSAALAKIGGESGSPALPAVALGGAALAVLAVNAGRPTIVEGVASAAIAWANLAYLFATAPMLARRLRSRGGPGPTPGGPFSLGRWGLPVNLLAVAWGVAVVVNVSWPRESIYGPGLVARTSAAWATALMLAAGGAAWAVARRRPGAGVLADHRASAPGRGPA